jgi:1-deoxy-D-xylulose-5-phosphate reductoisomerase
MVAFQDGSVIGQLGIPDMKAAIAYALSFPERLPLAQPLPDFSGGVDLTFREPDFEKFPCLALAFEACRAGGTLPAVNAANEVAVGAFLEDRISFIAIAEIIGQTMARHRTVPQPDLPEIIAADRWARREARQRAQAYPG